MTIFNSYVKLPEGRCPTCSQIFPVPRDPKSSTNHDLHLEKKAALHLALRGAHHVGRLRQVLGDVLGRVDASDLAREPEEFRSKIWNFSVKPMLNRSVSWSFSGQFQWRMSDVLRKSESIAGYVKYSAK